jgi:predicted kinase
VVLRTDEVRKRLAGAGAVDRLAAQSYTPEFYDKVYDTLFDEAAQLLRAGRAVVLDATFAQPPMRARAEALAQAQGVPFEGVWLEAPVEVLTRRIAERSGDASDATVDVLQRQIAQGVGEMTWASVDASGPAEEAAEAWSARHG